jgi:hypothetical protein
MLLTSHLRRGAKMIIALAGYARSGKNTVAEMIREELAARGKRGFEVSFAEPMKAFCEQVFGFDWDQLHGNARERPDTRWTRPDGTPLTARYALQTLGTEWGRNCDPNLWAKAGVLKAKAISKTGGVAIITDCRFINEAQTVRDADGWVCRVSRHGRAHAHASEAEIDLIPSDFEIDNRGQLIETRAQVSAALRKLLNN